jgi:predicted permease
MVGRALTYLVLYSTLGMVVRWVLRMFINYSVIGIIYQLRWSYGVRLLAQADPESVAVKDPEEDNETSLLLSASDSTIQPDDDERHIFHRQGRAASPITFTDDDDAPHSSYLPAIVTEDPDRLQVTRHRGHVFHSFPNTPSHSRVDLTVTGSTSPADSSPTQTATTDGEDSDDESPLPRHNRQRSPTVPTSTRFQSFLRRSRRQVGRIWKTFNEFMTVPLWAAVLSLIVACVQPLQHALEEHMQPVKGSLASAGNCSIPITLVVLGAYFYSPSDSAEDASKGKNVASARSNGSRFNSAGNVIGLKTRWRNYRAIRSSASLSTIPKPETRPGETRTVVIAILSRMIIVPLLLIPLMAVSTWYDWHAVFEE